MSTRRTVSGLVVAAGLLVGGGVAAGTLAASGALAATQSPSATPSDGASAPAGRPAPDADGDGRHGPGRHGHGGPMGALGGMREAAGRTLHGELVVEGDDGTTSTVLVQHGTVTATTDDTVTVRSRDGFTTTWKVTADTRVGFGRHGGTTSLDDLTTGTEVFASGPKTADGATASVIGARPADGTRPGRGGTPAPSPTTSSSSLTG